MRQKIDLATELLSVNESNPTRYLKVSIVCSEIFGCLGRVWLKGIKNNGKLV